MSSKSAMSGEDFQTRLKTIEQDFHQALEAASTQEDLERLRVEYLGRKGRLAEVMAGLPDLPDSERPSAGKQANLCKKGLLDLLSKKQKGLQTADQGGRAAGLDVSLPGRRDWVGNLHPVTLVLDEMCTAFSTIGFDIVTGPEIENDFYNFEALNIPGDHPARDMQDTLYITESIVLRTHTSPLQIRTMESAPPPLAVIAPGKVYRRDADLTHTPMFHQVEGFLVDEQVGMGDLRGTLTHFVHSVFSRQTKVRFRPSYFPFTEPSAEVDISCVICNGTGFCGPDPCRVCKQTGWVEILGCGMIDPAVFEKVGYDPEQWTGFAFGLGVERVAMLKYSIDDLRLFFENDTRFLGQFQQL